MTRHMVRFEVSDVLLAQVLALPQGAEIKMIVPAVNHLSFEFTVEHPALPAIEETEPIPSVSPIFHADYEKRPDTWLTFDWNLGSLRRE